MMFQTSGLNTGSVRLETLMTGLCWAKAIGGAYPPTTSKAATATAAKPRRNEISMDVPLVVVRVRDLARHVARRRARLYSAFVCVQIIAQASGGWDAAYQRARRDPPLFRGSRAGDAGCFRPRICRRLPHLGDADAFLFARASLRHLQPARLSALRRPLRRRKIQPGYRPR